jgi:hypothetical protein
VVVVEVGIPHQAVMVAVEVEVVKLAVPLAMEVAE